MVIPFLYHYWKLELIAFAKRASLRLLCKLNYVIATNLILLSHRSLLHNCVVFEVLIAADGYKDFERRCPLPQGGSARGGGFGW